MVKKRIFIDIDETICRSPDAPDYTLSFPIKENIEKANSYFEAGHHVVYWTARGAFSGKDWSEHTKKQLKEWGVKYSEIRFDKPHYDIFIDDKNFNVKDWNKITI